MIALIETNVNMIFLCFPIFLFSIYREEKIINYQDVEIVQLVKNLLLLYNGFVDGSTNLPGTFDHSIKPGQLVAGEILELFPER
jgi:hypothetical protein